VPTPTEEKSARLPLLQRGSFPAPEAPLPLVSGNSLAEKSAFLGLALLILYAAARSIYHALMRPFWYDEICTMLMVQQLHLHRLWQALAHGADGQPLPFYLLESAAAALIRNENLAYRGISILAFAVTLLCLFVAVRTRKDGAIALVCAAFSLTTLLFTLFAVEARGYSILVACIAFAIVCYQRVPARRWVILLGLSLVLAESFHYFAVFAFMPFFLAEAAHYGLARQLRRGVWIALLSSFLPLACFWPHFSALQKYYGPRNWLQPTLELALNSYSWYFLTTESSPGLYLAALAGLAVLFTMLATVRRTAQSNRLAAVPVNELMLVLGLLSLPLVGFAVAALCHSSMHPRYLLPSLLGFPLALGFTLPKLPRWHFLLPAVSAALFLCVIVPRERQFWSFYNGQFVSPAVFVEDFVSAGGHSDLPVVISDVLDFLPLQHYADQNWQKRFVVVLDPGQTLVDTGPDTLDKQLAILRQYANLPIYDWQPFLAEHPVFLLYSSNGGLDRDWWPRRLKKEGFKMQNVSVRPKETHDYFHRVILVTR
jgi:Dolichyl-phosphate-mannose-protein mannosyltransferase